MHRSVQSTPGKRSETNSKWFAEAGRPVKRIILNSRGGWVNQKMLFLCGMISPLLFIALTILGGALRPGYSHVSDTISELFSPGSPNKLLLDILHTTTALLSTLFGVGVLNFIRLSENRSLVGMIGAVMIITIGLVNVLTATIFPQDAWGAAPTFPGEMHKILAGVLALLSMVSIFLIGLWFHRSGIIPFFGIYSFITVIVVLLSGGYAVIKLGSPVMGLTERITILAGLQWTFILALKLFLL
jgi:hypothetical protein